MLSPLMTMARLGVFEGDTFTKGSRRGGYVKAFVWSVDADGTVTLSEMYGDPPQVPRRFPVPASELLSTWRLAAKNGVLRGKAQAGATKEGETDGR